MNVAGLVFKLAPSDPLVWETSYWSFDGTLRHKTYDPTQPLDNSSKAAYSESCRRRYGFGAPYKLDPSVLPAESVLPDAEHDMKGWWGEEGQAWLTAEAAKDLGLDFPLSLTDRTDLKALKHLVERYIYPLLDRTPPALPPPNPPVQPPSPPPVASPPAGSGLSAPEQRVDELWAWIGQQWPTVRPVAVAALKMFRKAVGR